MPSPISTLSTDTSAAVARLCHNNQINVVRFSLDHQLLGSLHDDLYDLVNLDCTHLPPAFLDAWSEYRRTFDRSIQKGSYRFYEDDQLGPLREQLWPLREQLWPLIDLFCAFERATPTSTLNAAGIQRLDTLKPLHGMSSRAVPCVSDQGSFVYIAVLRDDTTTPSSTSNTSFVLEFKRVDVAAEAIPDLFRDLSQRPLRLETDPLTGRFIFPASFSTTAKNLLTQVRSPTKAFGENLASAPSTHYHYRSLGSCTLTALDGVS